MPDHAAMPDSVETVLATGTTTAEPERAAGLMHIGEVADRVSLSHRTIRYYDESGLLVPTRSPGNFRLFAEADVQRLLLIRQMKPLGFSLEEMGQVMSLLEASAAGQADAEHRVVLQALLLEAQQRRDRMAVQLQEADELIDRLRSLH